MYGKNPPFHGEQKADDLGGDFQHTGEMLNAVLKELFDADNKENE